MTAPCRGAMLFRLLGLFLLIVPSAVSAVSLTASITVAITGSNEEFVGPFSSWKNVKTAYGAVGNGIADDTTPIQNCLNALGSLTYTCYLPAGSYKITAQLTLAAKQYVNVIGADPATTTIVWAGAAGGTMLRLNGVGGTKIVRLTFNGSSTAAVILDSSWDGSTGFSETGNSYSDDVFMNAQRGVRCGNLGVQCSEHILLRDTFSNNTVAGIELNNANALDIWVSYSKFLNNAIGVTNTPGAGVFNVRNSVFYGSTFADIYTSNTGYWDFTNNYSSGSSYFLVAEGSANINPSIVQGNTIVDSTHLETAVLGNLGAYVFLDNVVKSLSSYTTGPAFHSYTDGADVFSVGNTFTVTSPISVNGSSSRFHSFQDQSVAVSSVNPTPPTLPPVPANFNRTIFEVTPGMSAAQIQATIDLAHGAVGGKPVVHVQPGTYNIATTLHTYANDDMQIIGDGYNSRLASSGANPVLRLVGPSKVVLRDFSVAGGAAADAVEVTLADQAGSRVYIAHTHVLHAGTHSLFVDALDYTNVELHNFNHVYASATNETSVLVTGGAQASLGNWLGGKTSVFSAASAGNYYAYGTSSGAHLSVRNQFTDSGAGGALIGNVSGGGSFTFAGSSLNLVSVAPMFAFSNFKGTAALAGIYSLQGTIGVTGDGTGGKVLGLGLAGPNATFFSDTTSPADTREFLNGQYHGTAWTQLAELNCCDTTFLTNTLSQLRTDLPTLPVPLPGGVTDVRVYGLVIDSGLVGIHLKN